MTANTILLLVIYIALVLVIAFISRKRRANHHFDEMQEKIRAEGYKIAYLTIIILLCGIICVDSVLGAVFPKYFLGGLLMIVVVISIAVWGIYCIAHDSFFFLGQDWRNYFSICLIAGAVNLASFVMGLMSWFDEKVHTQSLTEMIFTKTSTSGTMAITFLALAAAIGVKMIIKKDTCED